MRPWKQHIVSKERFGQKHYLDRRRFNRWNKMSGGAALTTKQCNQLEEYVRNDFNMVERMTAGSRGCVFKLQADDGTVYIKKFMDREDYGAFNAVRGMFEARNLQFYQFHPLILAEGEVGGLYFVDMAVGDKVTILDDDTIANMLGIMHDNNLFHGDIFRAEQGASSFQEGSMVYVLNHANAVKMEDGSVRLIDFGNQYNHENPLEFEREQLESLEKGINVYNNRRLKTAKRRQEQKQKRKRERQEEGGQRKKRQRTFLEGLIKAEKKQTQETINGGACRIVSSEKHQCVRECQPTSLQDFARKLRHSTEIHPSTLENYILWRRTEQRANQVARMLGAKIPNRSLPATWYDNIVNLFGKFDADEQASENFMPEILMEDEPEGDAGIYEPIYFETLEAYDKYQNDYYEEFEARIRPKDPTSKWCVIYFRQHLVVAKLEANKIVVYNSSDPDFLPLYEETWGDMANNYFDTALEVEVIHLDVQGVNDCGIWVHMIPLYETDILNGADSEVLFEGFIKHF